MEPTFAVSTMKVRSAQSPISAPQPRARQDHEAHVRVGLGLSDSVRPFSGKVIVNGVEYLGSTGRDLSNPPIFLREYLGRHQTPLS